MHKLTIDFLLISTSLLACSSLSIAQVPVSLEPMHRPVFQNPFFRVLDVVLQPGDTTQFHIHSTPSLFLQFTDSHLGTQIKGKEWITEEAVAGNSWYRSFLPDILIHRVTNLGSAPFHVIDMEILSTYDATYTIQNKQLKYPVLHENEKGVVYQLTHKHFRRKIPEGRGPMIAALVSGEPVMLNNAATNQSKEFGVGHFQYIEPNTSYAFTTKGTSEMRLILFELK